MKSKDQTLLEEAYSKIQESKFDNFVDIIKDPKDRQAYIGLRKMEAQALQDYRKLRDPIRKSGKLKTAEMYRDQAYDILFKHGFKYTS
jgi:hypothetical protein